MTRVLHVTEAFGGGVTSAINTYANHSADCSHFLFALKREGDLTGEEDLELYCSVKFVARKSDFFVALFKYFREINPDVIHVHCSYAGLFVRINPFFPKCRIVYTPHAFPFLRNDNVIKLKLYRLLEYLLAKRTQIIAGCGRDEQNIAAELIGYRNTTELVNVCGQLPDVNKYLSKDKPLIVMIGRVCEQKGFRFFAEVASQVGDIARFLWIGGGDASGVSVLEASGVEVSGWIERREVLKLMNQASLYFHSAEWDGFPISVLEAAHYKIPIMLRSIGPFVAEGLSVVESPEDASSAIRLFVGGRSDIIETFHANANTVDEYHTSERLSHGLHLLYSQFKNDK